jgi:hypothetical protein
MTLMRSLSAPPRFASTHSTPPPAVTFVLPSPTPRCAALPRALTWLSIHSVIPHFDDGGLGTGGCLLESLHERIKVSLPNTRIGPNWFLTRCNTLVGRSDVLFWTPSEAGACWRAKTRYLSFDVRVLLNGA